MPALRVHKVYYLAHQDLVVIAGVCESGEPRPGMWIDLPREVQGPGWVPIRDVQTVAFHDGHDRLCVILDYEVLTSAPLMEFHSLEGLSLDLRSA